VIALKTLLMQSPKKLGHNIKCLSLRRPDSTKVKPLKVLGVGGFCVAFTATVKEIQGGKVKSVVKKPIRSFKNILEEWEISLSQLVLENKVLRAFATTSCAFLPRLYNAQWEVSNEFPYIVSQPEGISLRYYTAMCDITERRNQMVILYQNMLAGLEAALSVGFCHTDLRPDNVVAVGETFVIIDWGLATPPGTPFHEHRAGNDFYHDDVVFDEQGNGPLLFKAKFDKFSAKCVAYFFAEARTPWSKTDCMHENDLYHYVQVRKKYLSSYSYKRGTRKET